MNYLFNVTACFLFLCLGNVAFSQNLTYTHYDLSAFHPDAGETYFAEAANGDIWVLQDGVFTSDEDHVLVFDGNTWTEIAFDVCDNCTTGIANSPTGEIYLATKSGIFKRVSNSWEQVTTVPAAPGTNMTFGADGTLWFRAGGGLLTLHELSPTGIVTEHPAVQGNFFSTAMTPDGILWYTIAAADFYSYDGTTVTTYPGITSPNFVQVDANGNIWATDVYGGIHTVENGVLELRALTDVYGSFFGPEGFAIDPNRNIFWFGSLSELFFYDGANVVSVPSSELFTPDAGPDVVNIIFVAKDGSIWASTRYDSEAVHVDAGLVHSSELSDVEIALYPNPFIETLNIELEGKGNAIESIQLFDLTGKLVVDFKPSNAHATKASIDTGSLPISVYSLVIQTEEGRLIKKVYKN